jgi:pyruvate/2-oxoglutarate dehydrogenase complex dihydrolipoamide dehydrogenase (E3) component
MTDVLQPDLCVVGAGVGGVSVATAAAAMGVAVVLVEKGRFAAGAHAGNISSQALIMAARIAGQARQAQSFGIGLSEPVVDFARVHDHVQEVAQRLAPAGSAARLRALGIRVIEGAARFTGPAQLEAAGVVVRARRFVVATGASPIIPPIRGIETVRAHTPETIFDLTDRPHHLAIIGGGSTGMELAQAFRRLGSQVTVIDTATVLSQQDPELAQVALSVLRDEGVAWREGATISRIDPHGGGLALHLDGDAAPLVASHLLVTAGRRPNVDGLGLEAAGVAFDRSGISVRGGLRSSNRRVHAVGDVVALAPRSAHAASHEADLVLRAILFRQGRRLDRHAIPRVTFTDPEIAEAGFTEAEARAAGYKVSVLRWPFAQNDRARAGRQARGHVKVICDHRGVVLGAGIVGPQARELIAMWQLAVQTRRKIADLAEVVLPCPSLAEASKRAAVLSYGPSLRSPWLKRILRWLRLLG